MAQINYTIRKNRIERSFLTGFESSDDGGSLFFDENTGIHRLYLDVIDSATEDATWGRFSFISSLQENMVLYVYAAAYNYDTWYDDDGNDIELMSVLRADDFPDEEKKKIFSGENARRFVGKNDILLYGLQGRYLYLAIEVLGAGEGYIDRLRVDMKGDNFIDAFPSIYRENDSFFHRYLSIFSSIYNDLSYEIEKLPELLDPKTCPVECLPIYAKWLGIDVSGDYLTERAMRQIVTEGYELNRIKGTKACLIRIIEIVLQEKAIILESNTIKSYMEKEDMKFSEIGAGGIYDVNILIRQSLTETDRHQLLYLLNQFKPLRCKIHLIQLKDTAVLDDEVYLDMNAIISGESVGELDSGMILADDVVLDE